ncbi:MAG: hypothetical protein V5A32_06300, partial [Halovenus sp.]
VNRVVEQGLPPYLLREIDLVIFPRRVDGDRYVGEVVELLDEHSFAELDRDDGCGVVRKQGTPIYWNRIVERTTEDGFDFAYEHPELGDDGRTCHVRTLDHIATVTDRSLEAVEAEFHRKHRYVEHMVQEGIDDFEELFDLLADLQTNEAATVARLSRQAEEGSAGRDGDESEPSDSKRAEDSRAGGD